MDSKCPLCHKENFKVMGKPVVNQISKDFMNKDYIVVQCNNCRLYYVAPEIDFNDDKWAKLYNIDYFAKMSDSLNKRRRKELSKRFNKAQSWLPKNTKLKYLDIGTGEGRSLIEAKQRGWEPEAIDIVDNRVIFAKESGIKFIKGKFLEYDLPENYYDFVHLDSVLEHVLTPIEYLSKIKRILKPGGVVYIGVPNEDSLFNMIRRAAFNATGKKNISEKIKPFDTPYHVIGFNRDSLDYAINSSGLKVLSLINFGRKFEFVHNKITSKDFWINFVILFPVEFIGKLLHKDVYYAIYLTKK